MKPISNAPKVMDGEVKLISINMLKPFAKHSFTLYQGERLDDMVESIKKNGVIVPIIARNIENSDKFEIISGHNRVYASGLAGLEKVPAVIKVGLSDEEALVWAVETNLIQRGFSDLKISEQAFAVAMRYQKLFDEKKLHAIDEELQVLMGNNIPAKQCTPVGYTPKGRSQSLVAIEYGMGHSTVARLIRINLLCDELKKLVDVGNIRIRPAVDLSFIPIEGQKRLYEYMSAMGETTIDAQMAKELRQLYNRDSDFTTEQISALFSRINTEKAGQERLYAVPLERTVFDKYLKDIPKKEVMSVVEKALEMYFNVARA